MAVRLEPLDPESPQKQIVRAATAELAQAWLAKRKGSTMANDEHCSIETLPVHSDLDLRGPLLVRIDYHPNPEALQESTLMDVQVTGLHRELREGTPEGIAFIVGWMSSAIEYALLTAHRSEPPRFKTLCEQGQD